MVSRRAAWLMVPAAVLLASATGPGGQGVAWIEPDRSLLAAPGAIDEARPAPLPLVRDFLDQGVVIVVSKPTQQMTVFRDGALWGSSPVSTGRRGHSTPSGVFAILQKKAFHRSNIYSGAPMPYMQRLTWRGIAIHAGHLPGYPASHGCIRLPHTFARALFDLTRAQSTAVIVSDSPLRSPAAAFQLASNTHAAVPLDERYRFAPPVRLARSAPPPVMAPAPAPPAPAWRAGGQTIQLAAALSPGEAEQHWAQLVRAQPALGQMRPSIVPAVVNARQYYRLRASAPGAHALCGDLRRAGIACFAVS